MKRAAAALAVGIALLPLRAWGADLDRYTGFYELAPRLVASVTREGDHLAVQLTRQPKIDLVTAADGSFSFQGIAARIRFTAGPDNGVTGLVVQQNGREIAAPRIDAATAEKLQAPERETQRTWPMLTGTAVQVLTTTATDYWPTFSPDGATIIFSRTTDQKHWDLYKVPASGGPATLLARSPLPVSATRPRWSMPADLIAFTATTEDGRDQIWTIKPNGSGAHIIYGDGIALHLYYPDWAPDGKSLVMTTAQPQLIQRANLVTGKVEELTDANVILPGKASLSPDGHEIVFAGQKATGGTYNQNINTLWLIDAKGALHPLEHAALPGRAPSWSPDGRWIAFESDRGSPDERYAVFLIRRDGTGLVQVTDYLFNAGHPVFSHDMRHLAVTVGTGENTRIAVVELPELH
jgi:Tol biopolymer transport system component